MPLLSGTARSEGPHEKKCRHVRRITAIKEVTNDYDILASVDVGELTDGQLDEIIGGAGDTVSDAVARNSKRSPVFSTGLSTIWVSPSCTPWWR